MYSLHRVVEAADQHAVQEEALSGGSEPRVRISLSRRECDESSRPAGRRAVLSDPTAGWEALKGPVSYGPRHPLT